MYSVTVLVTIDLHCISEKMLKIFYFSFHFPQESHTVLKRHVNYVKRHIEEMMAEFKFFGVKHHLKSFAINTLICMPNPNCSHVLSEC